MPTADELISADTVTGLRSAIAAGLPHADLPLLRAASHQVAGLTLRQRVDLLQSALLSDIPGDYSDLAAAVRATRRAAAEFHGWMIWPVTEAIASRAIGEESTAAFDDAMSNMAEFTGLFTSEFAIRPLIRNNPQRALDTIRTWTASEDIDVRRLASEGTRPYLPWSMRIPEVTLIPGATIPILDDLYRDPSEYVRRSVANHLNDLSREQSGLVIDTAAGWLAAPDDHTCRVVRHSLRTLVKGGDTRALALLGFPSVGEALDIHGPTLDRDHVTMGESITLSATLRNTSSSTVRLAIDYVVHHRKANGRQTPKTFKLTTATLEPGQHIDVQRSHAFRPITTRRYYSGAHAIALQVNGIATEPAAFHLQVD